LSHGFTRYVGDIERFFCVVRLSGFILSPKDYERVRQWYLKGVPLQVVLNGILEGAKAFRYKASPGSRPPHQLSFYSHFIGAKVRRFRAEPPVADETEPEDDAVEVIDHLAAELELLALRESRPLERKVKEECLSSLVGLREQAEEGLDEQSLMYELQVLDEKTLALYHSLLDDEGKRAVGEEVEGELKRERGVGSKALEGRLKAITARVLRSKLNMMVLAE